MHENTVSMRAYSLFRFVLTKLRHCYSSVC